MPLFRRKPAPTPPPVVQAPAPHIPLGQPTATGINLTKGGSSSISLTKSDPTTQITAHLDWDGGSAHRRARGADLELYVLHVSAADVTAGGKRSQPIQGDAIYYRNLGSLEAPPYIRHHGDSLIPGRETATIARPDQQGYALICAYSAVGNGVGSFKEYGARAIITDGHAQTVNVPLYDDNRYAYWVAIALIDFTHDSAVISQTELYSREGSEARPVLYSNGRIGMDEGPVEFK
ncbi:TerD family protein [Streptomyces olivaceus]|uniref:TerD family protein n=1 Tax=Streptomyces olivaceus TaxID=47716 RepID=UPI001CCEC713|nr:TerD family protein [Streptomyces olivaceus]MBZ6258813.1 TerD family protein [Streptomyces olivaceus]